MRRFYGAEVDGNFNVNYALRAQNSKKPTAWNENPMMNLPV